MKNLIQDGKTLSLTAPSGGVLSGQGVLIGSLFVVACHDAAAGAKFNGQTSGVFKLPKATGALTEGAAAYWDGTAKKVTGTSTSNTLIGAFVADAASDDAEAKVLLK